MTEAVYIHIPFCRHKCYYCDFNTYALKGQPVDEYLDALEREMERAVADHPPGTIETIFVGGGTPTVLSPAQMERFLAAVREYFPHRSRSLEFTMEANPGTTDEQKLRVMKEGGVNRLSFGAQTFDNGLLKRIGRIHDAADIYESVEKARACGFSNLSIDLMFGLPDQTMRHLENSLDAAFSLQLPHYSIYSLKIEENTPFHTLYENNRLPLPDEDTELAMYERIMERMKERAYEHYEISNFARPGFAGRHNIMYWRNRPYYGLGAGAHGYVEGVRHANVRGVREYIEAVRTGLPRAESRRVDRGEAMEDFMMVGLRMLEGIRNSDFAEQFGVFPEEVFAPVFRDLLDRELLEETEKGYRLTSRGLIFGNEVFGAFIGRAQQVPQQEKRT